MLKPKLLDRAIKDLVNFTEVRDIVASTDLLLRQAHMRMAVDTFLQR